MAESLLEEEVAPSEAEKYILNTNIVENPDSTPKEVAFAQGVLELLKPIDQGGNMSMNEFSTMMQEVDKKMAENKRTKRQAGGSMMVPPEMEMEDVVSTEAPIDTYPNIPPEEMAEVEASQLPDEEMEEDYVDFVISEALVPEEQEFLRNTLEADP